VYAYGLSTQGIQPAYIPLSFFMSKWIKQTQAASYIRELLHQRGIDIPSKRLTLPDSQQWITFDYNGRQLGVDTASGIWIREDDDEWRCICMPCSVSGAAQAVEFLTQE
jgi:hypothetical protein